MAEAGCADWFGARPLRLTQPVNRLLDNRRAPLAQCLEEVPCGLVDLDRRIEPDLRRRPSRTRRRRRRHAQGGEDRVPGWAAHHDPTGAADPHYPKPRHVSGKAISGPSHWTTLTARLARVAERAPATYRLHVTEILRPRLSRLSARRPTDPELLHLGMQGRRLDAKPIGGAPGATDSPVGRLQRSGNRLTFGVRERADARPALERGSSLAG